MGDVRIGGKPTNPQLKASSPAVALCDFAEGSNAGTVRIEPGEDARALLDHIERIERVEVSFPAWTDGRGYSSARILREAGYAGELVAVGDIAPDMIGHLQRCGFDLIAPDKPIDPETVKATLERWENVYQATVVDGRQAIWAKRHPA